MPLSYNIVRKENSLISILIPCYNEVQVIRNCYERIVKVLGGVELAYEILVVDDGSTDGTVQELLELQQHDCNLRIITLSRNFGKEAALTCAIDYALGDAVVLMDADCQDPPELLIQMLELWRQGYDVVLATRRSRHGESYIKRISASLFYKIFPLLSDTPIPSQVGDFRLLDRKVVEHLKKIQERVRFMKGILAWVGFKTANIVFDRPERKHGETSWTYRRLFSLALDGIFSFSKLPLVVWTYLGSLILLFSLMAMGLFIFKSMFNGTAIAPHIYITTSIFLMGGVQLLSIGIIGGYLYRIYEESKRRPIYIVDEIYERKQKTDK